MANTKITSANLDTLTTLTVDDITIDGSTISDSGDLTLDVGGDIVLDAAGGDIILKNAGSTNGNIVLGDATNPTVTITSSFDFTLDIGGDIILDADGADVLFKDGGTQYGRIGKGGGSDLIINASIADKDIFFSGTDGSTSINALVLDMSDAGQAIFNSGASFEDGKLTINEFTSPSAFTQIRKTNTGSNLAIVSQESIYMLLDENNDQTNRAFFIEHGAGSPGTGSTVFKVQEDGKVGISNSSPAATLHVGGDGITVNTHHDRSRTAIFRTTGSGNYSTSSNNSAAHAATFMRGTNAVTGDQVGHSYVFDDGNWSATAEIMAEVENASNAYSRLNFKTWNGSMLTRQYITSDGQVIKPYQSAFVAVRNSTQSIAINQNIIFNQTYKNVGSDFNTTNGVYTAPFAGFYFFSYTILLQSVSTAFHVDHYLRTSNHSFIGGMPGRIEYQAGIAWGDGYLGMGHAQIAYMDEGDIAYVNFSELGGATRSVYGNNGNNWTKFTGYFLG